MALYHDNSIDVFDNLPRPPLRPGGHFDPSALCLADVVGSLTF